MKFEIIDKKENGGPAFPQRFDNHSESDIEFFGTIKPGKFVQFGGVTLRDYFAAKAMQAEISRSTYGIEDAPRDISECAYEYADAMLEERAK